MQVKDNGIGIEPDFMPRIFDLVLPRPPGRALAGRRLGLGLSLVQQVVLAHGGRVEARSEGLGRGSNFEVRLPLAEAADRVAPPPREEPIPEGIRYRLLVVDDDRDGGEALASYLNELGHEVTAAADGTAHWPSPSACSPSWSSSTSACPAWTVTSSPAGCGRCPDPAGGAGGGDGLRRRGRPAALPGGRLRRAPDQAGGSQGDPGPAGQVPRLRTPALTRPVLRPGMRIGGQERRKVRRAAGRRPGPGPALTAATRMAVLSEIAGAVSGGGSAAQQLRKIVEALAAALPGVPLVSVTVAGASGLRTVLARGNGSAPRGTTVRWEGGDHPGLWPRSERFVSGDLSSVLHALPPQVAGLLRGLAQGALGLLPLGRRGHPFGLLLLARAAGRFGPGERGLLRAAARQAARVLELNDALARTRDALEARDQFLVLASHELAGPLATASLLATAVELAVERKPGTVDDQTRAALRMTRDQLDRASALVRRLAEAARRSHHARSRTGRRWIWRRWSRRWWRSCGCATPGAQPGAAAAGAPPRGPVGPLPAPAGGGEPADQRPQVRGRAAGAGGPGPGG